jgi:hypothetical protein
MRRGIVIVIACAAVVALAGPSLVGARARDEVTLKVKPTTPGSAKYTGQVKSSKRRCRKGRTVRVYHDSDPPFLIGETETDNAGKYVLEGISPPAGDRVFVVVKKEGDGESKCRELNDSAKVPPS